MDDPLRWLVGLFVAALIIGLLLVARGGAERGNPEASPAAVVEARA